MPPPCPPLSTFSSHAWLPWWLRSTLLTVTTKTKTNLEEVLQRPDVAACIAALPKTEPVK